MLDMAEKKPARTGKSLGVYVDTELSEAFGRYIEQSRPRTTRTAVIEMLLEQFLTEKGFWPAEEPEEQPEQRKRKHRD